MKILKGMKDFASMENKKLDDLKSIKGGAITKCSISSGTQNGGAESKVYDDNGNYLFTAVVNAG